ncbi:hypothetical protein A1OE_95 [Candidatus Endolissoclinum faulkneri L2]|uniref:Uncharacterized protein n=1 Tax=Candidatus Endolissoclinum faulkneri L2 TaxID=1193729 RepID=K7ZC52_9PROT|nr:hypothetical protein A1OE_95 [Candidatus Endolissoclinum faulkneri L2]
MGKKLLYVYSEKLTKALVFFISCILHCKSLLIMSSKLITKLKLNRLN